MTKMTIPNVLVAAMTIAGCGADLVVTDIEAPEVLTAGEEIGGQVAVTYANRGDAASSSSAEEGIMHYDMLLSTDEVVPNSPAVIAPTLAFQEDALLRGGRNQVPGSLEPGAEARDVDRSLLLPMALPGRYYICARVDSIDNVEEDDDTNNSLCRSVVIVNDLSCIDFESSSWPGAESGVDASSLYTGLGVGFPTAPVIFRQPPLFDRFQGLYQGDPDSPRPEASCGPLEIRFDPRLDVGTVTFEARNVGFISMPVHIVATASHLTPAALTEVDRFSVVSRSRPGDLNPFDIVTLESHPGDETEDPPILEEPAITQVLIEYGTCLPHVAIDNLCWEPKERDE